MSSLGQGCDISLLEKNGLSYYKTLYDRTLRMLVTMLPEWPKQGYNCTP
jgi:hypothetical protein